ncbi:hypothetical protein AYI70_g6523 [Smittium culicis]|uniref:Uncharacterized protein n=1 Tax=Smittium culicis TaxID=133412 RepID=A0A1R1XPK5_9FUNG|nr:hypothetical protein AYI70_g6523 [Smittium culicis]
MSGPMRSKKCGAARNDKEVDTKNKFTLVTDGDKKESKKAAANTKSGTENLGTKYNGTRYYTPGSALRKPLTTEWVDMTSEDNSRICKICT